MIFADRSGWSVDDNGGGGSFNIVSSVSNSFDVVYTAPTATGSVTLRVLDNGVVSDSLSILVLGRQCRCDCLSVNVSSSEKLILVFASTDCRYS